MFQLIKTIRVFRFIHFAPVILIFLLPFVTQAQEQPVALDTTIRIAENKPPDSVTVEFQTPGKAALRSAIVPGLGQIYNRKIWKVPIIYAALGITTYVFVDNIKTYREYRFAYAARIKAQGNMPDSTDYFTLKEIYKVISPESIRAARDEFRKYIDYSVLFFILFWGLNVVDAAVDAHLRTFDVSPDLGLKIRAGYSELAGTSGVSLILPIGK